MLSAYKKEATTQSIVERGARIAVKWIIDPSHTSLQMAVTHMAISTVRGQFKRVTGTIETADDGTLKSIEGIIDAASIDTAEPRRDAHLRSPDFLDAEKYPNLIFRSTAIQAKGGGKHLVKGDLTIREETRPVSLEVEAGQPITDPYGNLRAGASATGKVDRKGWGLTWNQVLELGALLVGEEVRFTLDVEAFIPAAAPAVT